MAQIESLAEGGAFMDALEAVDQQGLLIGDGEIEAFREIWKAGRDWQREQDVNAELLAALELHVDPIGHTAGCCANGICACPTTCTQTRAAIAKAKGEQP